MKITVERDRLVAVIGEATRVVGRNLNIPILNNLLLEIEGAVLRISATKLDAWYSATLPAEVDGEDNPKVTVLGSALHGIVNGLPKGAQVQIGWNDTGDISVRSGRARYSLKTLPAADFPALQLPARSVEFDVPAKPLITALSAVRYAIGTDHTRPWMNGIFMHAGSDAHPQLGGNSAPRLVFAASDGIDLARASIALPAGAGKAPAVILPDFAIPEILRMASETDGDVHLGIADHLVSVTVGQAKFVTKLIDSEFPEYARIIPIEVPTSIAIDSIQLSSACARLKILADIKLTKDSAAPRTRVDISPDGMTISLANHIAGDAEERVDGEIVGESMSFMFKLSSVIDILNSMPTDRVAIKLTEPTKPIVFQPMYAAEGDGVSRCYVTAAVSY